LWHPEHLTGYTVMAAMQQLSSSPFADCMPFTHAAKQLHQLECSFKSSD